MITKFHEYNKVYEDLMTFSYNTSMNLNRVYIYMNPSPAEVEKIKLSNGYKCVITSDGDAYFSTSGFHDDLIKELQSRGISKTSFIFKQGITSSHPMNSRELQKVALFSVETDVENKDEKALYLAETYNEINNGVELYRNSIIDLTSKFEEKYKKLYNQSFQIPFYIQTYDNIKTDKKSEYGNDNYVSPMANYFY